MKISQRLIQATLFTLLIIPLVGADSCSSAVERANDDEEKTVPSADVSPDTIGHADKMPVLPEGDEGEKLLKSGGPEVISIPPSGE